MTTTVLKRKIKMNDATLIIPRKVRRTVTAPSKPILLLRPAEYDIGGCRFFYVLKIDIANVMIYECCDDKRRDRYQKNREKRLICIEDRHRAMELSVIATVLNDMIERRWGKGEATTFANLDAMVNDWEREVLDLINSRMKEKIGRQPVIELLPSEVYDNKHGKVSEDADHEGK